MDRKTPSKTTLKSTVNLLLTVPGAKMEIKDL